MSHGLAAASAAADVDRGATHDGLARVVLRIVAVTQRRRGLRRAAGIQGLERGAGRIAEGWRAVIVGALAAAECASSSARSRAVSCSSVLAALFARALRYAGAADPGFDPRRRRRRHARLVGDGESQSTSVAFWRTVIDRVREIPAVESASLARVPPGGFEGIGLGGVAPGDQPGTTQMISPAWNIVDDRLLRNAPRSDRRGARFCADGHRRQRRPWPSSASGSLDASGLDRRRSESP